MNYKSILLSTFDVQAIIDGRKTQTRRVIKPHNAVKAARRGGYRQGDGLWIDNKATKDASHGYIKDYSVSSCWINRDIYLAKYSPCQPGDVLWVRETWHVYSERGRITEYIYKANCPDAKIKWRPSIHMPRDAARLFLRVTDVRAEWVQDISEKDAKAEGVIANDAVKVSSYTWWFHQLWDELNAKRGYGWDTNPWVWVFTGISMGKAFCCDFPGSCRSWDYDDYGKTWLAYDRKPEEGSL